jgi:hypothetical protein
VLSIPTGHVASVIEAAGAAGVPAADIGAVTQGLKLSVATARGNLEWLVSGLRMGWETSIETAMKRPGLS